MKTMNLWMGAAAALVMATGCGGSPCEEMGSSIRDFAERVQKCDGSTENLTEAQLDALFDTETCESRSATACTDKEAEAVGQAFSCMFSKITCDNYADEEALDTELLECEEEAGDTQVRLSCLEAMFPDDVLDPTTGQAVRQVLSRKLVR